MFAREAERYIVAKADTKGCGCVAGYEDPPASFCHSPVEGGRHGFVNLAVDAFTVIRGNPERQLGGRSCHAVSFKGLSEV